MYFILILLQQLSQQDSFMILVRVLKIIISVMVLLALTNTSMARNIDEVAANMGVSNSEATQILQAAFALIKEVQVSFTQVASHQYSFDQKVMENGLIEQTIESYFASKNVPIEVSNTNGTSVKRTVYNYLQRIANFSRNGTYETIQLRFGKDIHFDRIYTENGDIVINAEALQLFEGCSNGYEGRSCYTDITKKTFVVRMTNGLGYVSAIKVIETFKANDKNIKY